MSKGEKKRITGLSEIVEHSVPIMDVHELARSSSAFRWVIDVKSTYYCLARQFERLLQTCEEEGIMIANVSITQERFPDQAARPLYRITIEGY